MGSCLLERCEQDRYDTADTTQRGVRVQGRESHPALESDQFAHSRHRGVARCAKGTMKRLTSQGIAA